MSTDGYDFGSDTGAIPRVAAPVATAPAAGRRGSTRASTPITAPRGPSAPAPANNLLMIDPGTTLGANAKFLIPFTIAVLLGLKTLLAVVEPGPRDVATFVAVALTAALVWLVPNLKRGPGQYLKAAIAVLSPVAQYFIQTWSGGAIDPSEWVTIALTALSAFAVGAVGNTEALPPAASRHLGR